MVISKGAEDVGSGKGKKTSDSGSRKYKDDYSDDSEDDEATILVLPGGESTIV